MGDKMYSSQAIERKRLEVSLTSFMSSLAKHELRIMQLEHDIAKENESMEATKLEIERIKGELNDR